ncbi:MAG: ferredoxin-type protein NapF [Oleispira sp.]|nr:ferredoxin-type protein NapF [Oleispira sp.]
MANIDHSRRAFFRRPAALVASGNHTAKPIKEEASSENRWLPQRPPWALSESLFTDKCTRCHECISACEEEIIFIGDGGFPEIDFNRGECTFCEACIDTCKPAALLKQVAEHTHQQVFYFDITIDDSCLAKQKTHCQSCKDACDTRAITMPWPKGVSSGAIQTPEINIEDCTSCGACISICPSESISINPIASPNQAVAHKVGAPL